VPITAIPTAPPICCDWLAVAGHHLLIAVVNGFTLDETSPGQPPGGPVGDPGTGDGTAPQPSPNAASEYLASLPPAQFPNLTVLAGHFTAADPDERFELLLDIFVDGLARRAAVG